MKIHLGRSPATPEQLTTGEALCRAGWATRTEFDQTVTAIFDDVTCRNCIRIVRAENRREDAHKGEP